MEDETEQKMDADEKDEETEETKEKNVKEKRRMENKEMGGRSPDELVRRREEELFFSFWKLVDSVLTAGAEGDGSHPRA